METRTLADQLVPALLSAATPGLGQFVQGRFAMAAAQFVLTGALWRLAGERPLLVLAVLVAHRASALSAARWRPRRAHAARLRGQRRQHERRGLRRGHRLP